MLKNRLIKIFIFVLCFITVLGSYFFISKIKNNKTEDVVAFLEPTSIEETTSNSVKNFYVDVKGEVKTPGVYLVSEGMLVIDAINLAGGLTKNAYTNNINLSLKVFDEMVIFISNKKDVTTTTSTIKNKNDALITNKTESNNTYNGLVNINTASKDELMTISGIGESKANSIIEYRSKNKFESIEDIMNVPGIGEKFFEQIKNYITV